jgi:hypothetical protein
MVQLIFCKGSLLWAVALCDEIEQIYYVTIFCLNESQTLLDAGEDFFLIYDEIIYGFVILKKV